MDDRIIRLGCLLNANICMIFDGRDRLLDPADWPAEAQIGVKRLRCSRYGVGVWMHDSLAAFEPALMYALLTESGLDPSQAIQEALRHAPAHLRRLVERGEPGKLARFQRAVRALPRRFRAPRLIERHEAATRG
ncbi:MAG: hypothetical protein ACT4P4_25775 [Betaproteobacteria bacterium]